MISSSFWFFSFDILVWGCMLLFVRKCVYLILTHFPSSLSLPLFSPNAMIHNLSTFFGLVGVFGVWFIYFTLILCEQHPSYLILLKYVVYLKSCTIYYSFFFRHYYFYWPFFSSRTGHAHARGDDFFVDIFICTGLLIVIFQFWLVRDDLYQYKFCMAFTIQQLAFIISSSRSYLPEFRIIGYV